MGARWYDAALGRWTAADTIVPDPNDPQSFNRYSWVRNNPLKYIDPSGHFQRAPMIDGLYSPGYRGLIPPNPKGSTVGVLAKPDPYVASLWQNPQVAIPVLYAKYYESKGNAPEALTLTLDWYYERDNDGTPRVFGLDSDITRFLMTSRGVQEAREQFLKGGGEGMLHHHEFPVDEFFVELAKAILNDDWSGSFLGSYDVEISNVDDYSGPGNRVFIKVENDTGWASATKIPFLGIPLRSNEAVGVYGPGGTLWQWYLWEEMIYWKETINEE